MGTSVPIKPPTELPIHWKPLFDLDPAKLWTSQREQSPLSALRTTSAR